MPDGRVVVGVQGEYQALVFDINGNLVKRFIRRGSGPGEMPYLVALLRCGDAIAAISGVWPAFIPPLMDAPKSCSSFLAMTSL